MKNLLITGLLSFFVLSGISCANTANAEAKEDGKEKSGVIYLTKDTFKEKVFNYEKSKEWKYNGKVPAILDFYADWCGPCKMLAPILDDLQNEYGEKIQIFKINTEKERELSTIFGIKSLPTIVFIPVDGEPQAAMGFRQKADMEKMITEILKIKK